MARYDVFRGRSTADPLFLDCQSDLLVELGTRFVVPLLVDGDGPPPVRTLNPAFEIEDVRVIMYTQFAAAIAKRELGPVVASLAHEDYAIGRALDVLIGGV